MDQKIPRILIVDDDPNLLTTMSDILKVKGFEPILAQIGEEALILVEQYPIDVALIDIRLAGMSGLDVLRGIKKRCPQIECILLTGYASQNSAIEAIQIGAYGYFQKPFDMDQMLLSIQRAVEKHWMDDAFKQSEAHYRLLADHITDLVWLMDMNLQITYKSPSMQKLQGFTLDEHQILSLDQSLTPASFRMVMDFFATEIPKVLADPTYQLVGAMELEFYRKDGSSFWSENKFSIIHNEQGNPTSILGEGRDITERKKSEEALYKVQELLAAEKELLSTTLMSIADGVIVTDKDGLVILFNRAAESITGYTLSEAFKKTINSIFQLYIPNTLEIVPDVITYLLGLEKIEQNQMLYRYPLLRTKTGERILLSGSITSLKSADLEEDIVGFVMVFQNINEKQKAEAQNALSQKMQAIGQLAAGIAHEINTPIQYVGDNIKFLGKAYSKYSETLAAYQQVIQDHSEKPITQDEMDQLEELTRKKKISYYANEIPKAIQESLDGTERVRKIVLAMREFSHPSEKEKQLFDINHGIETTIVISRNEWKYCADLKTDLDDELPLVYCQIDEINQVVLNMIVNAAQAIQDKLPRGSEQKGKILITTRKHENKVFITVQDTGNGIPPEIRARIFDPFFTTKGVGKGTGQGLSMAHNIIVNKHHGTIGVDSAPGQGTTFTIELPTDSSKWEQK